MRPKAAHTRRPSKAQPSASAQDRWRAISSQMISEWARVILNLADKSILKIRSLAVLKHRRLFSQAIISKRSWEWHIQRWLRKVLLQYSTRWRIKSCWKRIFSHFIWRRRRWRSKDWNQIWLSAIMTRPNLKEKSIGIPSHTSICSAYLSKTFFSTENRPIYATETQINAL